ncbi:hypothetical protein BY996DRAFT_8490114 [Phakopsora pachyrhizi]|nr:hypothetical protein BY996DRAFT_8490114 [Phakopsora pachyrhizi]
MTNEQTLVNKISSQPDEHLLTPENSIKPLVVSQQPSLTRLSKGYKSQTDCSSSSSPILDAGNEIGVSNYHPASNDLASSQYKFWNDYDQADLEAFDEIDAQYALRHSNLDTSLCSSAVTGAKGHWKELTMTCIPYLSPATALNIPLEMDENLEEPQVATQAPLKTFQTPLKGLINNTVPKPIRKDHFHMVDESIFGFTTGHGKQITPPYEESTSIEISDAHSGTPPNPLNKGHDATLHSTGPQLTPPKEIFINKDIAEPIAALNGKYQGSSSALSDLPSIQLVSDRKAISHTNLETNGKLGMIRIREQTEDVFNVQAGSSVHTRALNNSKRFQSLEAVDKDFTPTRKGSQLDESTSSNFQKKSKEDLHILSPIYDTSPVLVKHISNRMNIGLTPQLLSEPFGAIHAIEQLARTIGELEIEDLMELESGSDREEDILLLHDLYTKRYLVPQSSIKLSKTYSPKDLMQLSPSNFKQLTWTTHIAFGKLCDLLRGDSIFYNNPRHKQIALEIQVAVGLSRLGSNGHGASIGKIQMIFGVGEGTVVLYTKRVIQAIHNLKDYKVKWPSKEEQKESSQVMQLEGFPNCVGFVDGTSLPLSQKPALNGNVYFDHKKSCHDSYVSQQMRVWTNKEDYFDEGEYILADSAYASSEVVVPTYWVSTCTTEEKNNI